MIDIYKKLSSGHLYQQTLTNEIKNYDSEYSAVYNTYVQTDFLSKLRYAQLLDTIGDFKSICDFGYGNGSFLNYCLTQNKQCFGYDISGYPLQTGITKLTELEFKTTNFDVVTFFDSIEHLPQENLVQFLLELNANNLCISVPWYHESRGFDWFTNWKHRRENEHLHHFDSSGLINLFVSSGYIIKYIGNFEDEVRTPVDEYPNILTIIGSKKYK